MRSMKTHLLVSSVSSREDIKHNKRDSATRKNVLWRYYHKVGERCIPNNIHITLVLLAYVFLVGITVQDRSHHAPQQGPAVSAPLIALTPSEVHHLLARLIWPAPTSVPLICHWSCWRRTHQYWAGY